MTFSEGFHSAEVMSRFNCIAGTFGNKSYGHISCMGVQNHFPLLVNVIAPINTAITATTATASIIPLDRVLVAGVDCEEVVSVVSCVVVIGVMLVVAVGRVEGGEYIMLRVPDPVFATYRYPLLGS